MQNSFRGIFNPKSDELTADVVDDEIETVPTVPAMNLKIKMILKSLSYRHPKVNPPDSQHILWL
jgi:hypothetical protein